MPFCGTWRDVNLQRIRELVTGGFQPFVIRMSDVRGYAVPHPEFFAIGKGFVVVIDKKNKVNTLDALHITAIDGQFSSKNGR